MCLVVSCGNVCFMQMFACFKTGIRYADSLILSRMFFRLYRDIEIPSSYHSIDKSLNFDSIHRDIHRSLFNLCCSVTRHPLTKQKPLIMSYEDESKCGGHAIEWHDSVSCALDSMQRNMQCIDRSAGSLVWFITPKQLYQTL